VQSFVRTILTLACALYLGGAHWMVLQVTAWTGMLVSRAPERGLIEAVETTFSGEQPCNLCAAVQEGQKEERQQQPLIPGLGKIKELQFLAMKPCIVPVRTNVSEFMWLQISESATSREEAPPTPPPLA
jgi:hypothetical protein